MREYRIATVPGDGIGPEVVAEGMKVMSSAFDACGVSAEFVKFPFGAEHYSKTGETISEKSLEGLKGFDAMYFGAIGDPSVPTGVLEGGILLRLRFHFDQYVNLRPVKLYEGVPCPLVGKSAKDVDFYVVRENTEDFYVGLGGRTAGRDGDFEFALSSGMGRGTLYSVRASAATDEEAFQIGILTKGGCRRVMTYAFELARKRGKTLVTSVDKANVINMYSLWREAFEEVSRHYPGIGTEYAFVDATCMWFVKNPEHYQVVVAPNLFGDVITDLGAMIQGGMGLAPGANINPEGISMFEPIHGSAPKYRGLNVANPIASILAGKMMLEFLAERHGDARMAEAAELVEGATADILRDGRVRTRDIGGSSSTSQVGDAIAKRVEENSG